MHPRPADAQEYESFDGAADLERGQARSTARPSDASANDKTQSAAVPKGARQR